MTSNNNRRGADKMPTWTSLTRDALAKADDFMTFDQLCAATGANHNQMSATLHHLKRSRVVEAMEAEGRLWWYLTGEDARSKSVEVRTPEPPGNRTRRRKTDPKA